MQSSGFEDKLLSKLDKIDPDQVQGYLSRILTQKYFLQTIFDHLDEGIIVTNRKLVIFFVNRKARSMLGWPRDRILTGENLDLNLAADHPLHDTLIDLRNRPRAIEGFEFAHGLREERMLSLSTLPMRALGMGEPDDGGEDEELLILLLHDVTERYRRQAEQARARRLTSMATLTSGVAHEIKNPLNSLNIHAQILAGEIREAKNEGHPLELAKAERAVEVIMEETKRLSHIVEQFIQAARPGVLHSENCDPRPLIERLEKIFRPECERAGISLTVTIEPDLPQLFVDEQQIMQALRNLTRNAIEALAERQEQARRKNEAFEPRIDIQARLDGDYVSISVGDNGPGITEESLEHIFEPYFTTKFSGSGLGLMVVYRIVNEHRGTLHVDTRLGEGTCFIVSLPLHKRPIRLLGQQAVQTARITFEERKDS